MNDAVTSTSCDFSENWMAWLALRHFLSSHLLRELVAKVVAVAGYDVSDLFEEVYAGAVPWNDRWIIRPREVPDGTPPDGNRAYLVRMVESVVAQKDSLLHGNAESVLAEDLTQELLDLVVRFGAVELEADFDSWDSALTGPKERLQPSFRALLMILKWTKENRDSPDLWDRISAQVARLDMPLRVVVVKHIADLLSDADAWGPAKDGYEVAHSLLSDWAPDEDWKAVASAWNVSVAGSRGAALAITESDPKCAADLLESSITVTLEQDPQRVVNLIVDAVNAARHPRVNGYKHVPRECVSMAAPLLVSSHHDGVARRLSRHGDYETAGRLFWALLRRQIALGAAQACRVTKAAYAGSLFAELSAGLGSQQEPDSFYLAARMLIESGDIAETERLTWSGPLLAAYLDEICVAKLMDHASKYPGNAIRRGRVLIKLFTAWACECRAPARQASVLQMWRHLAALAKQFPSAFEQALDLGRPSLIALKELARKRPELRAKVMGPVKEAICVRLRSPDDFWIGKGDACEAATAYGDAFSSDALENVLEAVLEVLVTLETGSNLWLLSRPALAFLVSTWVTGHIKSHPRLGPAIVREILHVGLEQETERRNILFYLHNFNTQLLSDPEVSTTLRSSGVIAELEAQATQHNSPLINAAISSLLLAPTVSGRKGVEAALTGLHEILSSAGAPRPTGELAMAYNTLLNLLNTKARLEEALPEDHSWLNDHYQRLFVQIPFVWDAVVRQPVVFARFSIPASEHADPTIVHNWAVASLRFAEDLNQSQVIDDVLRSAAERAPELAKPIVLARNTRAMTRPVTAEDIEHAHTDDPDAFYANVGRHLAQLGRSAGQDQSLALWAVLVKQCLRFGPQAIDAAVFLEAVRQQHLREYTRNCEGFADYKQRLRATDSLRLTLEPIIDLFDERTFT